MRGLVHVRAIVVHGSWTRPGVDPSAESIRGWHEARGFDDIGYHAVIRRSGHMEAGRPIEYQGAHARGRNHDTLGVVMNGGRARADARPELDDLDEFLRQEVLWEANYTAAQYRALGKIHAYFGVPVTIPVMGHRDVPGTEKRCPGFDVGAFFERLP